MRAFNFTVLVVILLVIFSCKSENLEDYLSNNNQNVCGCIVVTYNEDIKTILDNNCSYCHTNQAVSGCDLDSYQAVIDYLQHEGMQLYDYVKNNDHQGVELDSCSLKKLQKWIYNPVE
ncbi:MAG: hypothetical protein WHW07_08070 [Bacteroidales bacterium]|jgi:hypothetical protein|nr:hypothetical protein [Bacteroidales bacterium]HOL98557.1 hypothetical protein [Bacteroidales bacterium]HOM37155.1 hypothetical protein [Bacteroidales bacterium]HPD24762.1 hypothetical protein [Bacteroidales bacterium]HRT00506.1 hypothetical protein [Bacteroidales bacterium]